MFIADACCWQVQQPCFGGLSNRERRTVLKTKGLTSDQTIDLTGTKAKTGEHRDLYLGHPQSEGFTSVEGSEEMAPAALESG